jgi:hypothetical protein
MSNVIVHLAPITPFFFSGRPTHARVPLAPLSPPPAARWAPPVSITAAWHYCRGPPVSLTPVPSIQPAACARRTSRAPAGFGPLPAGRCSPIGRDPPCSCRFLHASAASPDPPPPAPFKKGTPPPADRILLPRAPFVSPVHTRVPHMLPHRPGLRLASFPLPEPLLRAGLRSSDAAVPPLQ